MIAAPVQSEERGRGPFHHSIPLFIRVYQCSSVVKIFGSGSPAPCSMRPFAAQASSIPQHVASYWWSSGGYGGRTPTYRWFIGGREKRSPCILFSFQISVNQRPSAVNFPCPSASLSFLLPPTPSSPLSEGSRKPTEAYRSLRKATEGCHQKATDVPNHLGHADSHSIERIRRMGSCVAKRDRAVRTEYAA